jgi:hypothetical protein
MNRFKFIPIIHGLNTNQRIIRFNQLIIIERTANFTQSTVNLIITFNANFIDIYEAYIELICFTTTPLAINL